MYELVGAHLVDILDANEVVLDGSMVDVLNVDEAVQEDSDMSGTNLNGFLVKN